MVEKFEDLKKSDFCMPAFRFDWFELVELNRVMFSNHLQLQLSEVIVRARRYYQEVTGKDGFVLEGKVGKDAFENRFKEKGVYEGNDDVQQWLSHMTADKKG